MIVVKHKRTSLETIQKNYPGATVIDVTSKADSEYKKFSPFYPHRGIPVPFSPGVTAACVEGIWQGLKVFETRGIEAKMFTNDTMKNIKRSTRRYGKVLGHRQGVSGSDHMLLDYVQARKLIYLPSYLWVLENKLEPLVGRLKALSADGTVVLLDYNTNPDIEDPTSPVSHAALIKAYIEGNYPRFEAPVLPKMLHTGQWVVHEKLGPGEIVMIEGPHAEVRFANETVLFDQYGDSLRLITPDRHFTRMESSRGFNATLCLNEKGRWGAMPNPDNKQEAIPCEYEEIHFYAACLVAKQRVPTFYFLVKNEGKWGLLSKTGHQQSPCVYDMLTPIEGQFGLFVGFEYRQGPRRGMINGKGEEI